MLHKYGIEPALPLRGVLLLPRLILRLIQTESVLQLELISLLLARDKTTIHGLCAPFNPIRSQDRNMESIQKSSWETRLDTRGVLESVLWNRL